MPLPLFHIITSLNIGGAETMLCQVLEHTDRSRYAPQVISLRPEAPLSPRVRAAGVPLHHLDMRGWRSGRRGLAQLKALLRQGKPAVVQTWMYHANLLGSLALAGQNRATRPPLVWNITHGAMPRGSAKLMSQFLRRALAPVSHRSPEKIIVCAHSAIEEHTRLGYARERMVYVTNGVDCERFRPDATARHEVRASLGIPADAPVIGIAARNTLLKDYPTFFAAARLLQQELPEAHFIACGGAVTAQDPALAGAQASCPRPEQVHLLGPRQDMPRIYASWDLGSLCSICEAQPLTLCEALACGIPSVATDVGDSADILGDAGLIVPQRDPAALAHGWKTLLTQPARLAELQSLARQRALTRFALPTVTETYHQLYDSLLPPK